MWGLVWGKSEYSRLVSASLNIPDRSYCVQRDSEGERATDKGKCTRFSENSWVLTLDCTSFDSFILCNKIHEGLSRYFYICWLAGPSSRGLSLLQRLCLISIFMVSGGREAGERHVLPKGKSIPSLMYNLNPRVWSTAPLTIVEETERKKNTDMFGLQGICWHITLNGSPPIYLLQFYCGYSFGFKYCLLHIHFALDYGNYNLQFWSLLTTPPNKYTTTTTIAKVNHGQIQLQALCLASWRKKG